MTGASGMLICITPGLGIIERFRLKKTLRSESNHQPSTVKQWVRVCTCQYKHTHLENGQGAPDLVQIYCYTLHVGAQTTEV